MNVRHWIIFILTCFLMGMAGSGCSNQEHGQKAKGQDKAQVVAMVGGKAIGKGEFKRYLSRSSAHRRGRLSERAARDRLNQMIASEALYQEALNLGIDKDPEVRRKIRQITIQKLLEEKVIKPVETWQISEDELQEYYESHKSRYYRPEQVRLADIFIAVPEDASPEERLEKRHMTEGVLKKAISGKSKRFGFSQLIREYSDRPARYRRGDTGFFDREGNPARLDRGLVEAGFKLKRIGEIADHVVETQEGFHVIMLVGRRSEIKRELRDLAPMLKQRMKREKLEERKKAFIEEAKKKSNVEIDEEIFVELVKEMNESQSQGGGMSNKAPVKRGPPGLPKQR